MGAMREQTRLITLRLTEEDVADGFSVKETESSFLLLRHGRVIAEFSGARAGRTEAEEIERRMGLLLSPWETEILQYIARGNETNEIASALGLKRRTVKSHINRIMRKLGAKNRAHAVALALRSGLIN